MWKVLLVVTNPVGNYFPKLQLYREFQHPLRSLYWFLQPRTLLFYSLSLLPSLLFPTATPAPAVSNKFRLGVGGDQNRSEIRVNIGLNLLRVPISSVKRDNISVLCLMVIVLCGKQISECRIWSFYWICVNVSAWGISGTRKKGPAGCREVQKKAWRRSETSSWIHNGFGKRQAAAGGTP